MIDEVRRCDKAKSAAGFIREDKITWEIGVEDRDDCDVRFLVRILEGDADILLLVAQVWEWMVRIDHLRREIRLHCLGEVFLQHFLLIIGDMVRRNLVDSVLAQLAHELHVAFLGARDHALDLVVDHIQLLRGRHARFFVDLVWRQLGSIRQPADAHHEKLIQI